MYNLQQSAVMTGVWNLFESQQRHWERNSLWSGSFSLVRLQLLSSLHLHGAVNNPVWSDRLQTLDLHDHNLKTPEEVMVLYVCLRAYYTNQTLFVALSNGRLYKDTTKDELHMLIKPLQLWTEQEPNSSHVDGFKLQGLTSRISNPTRIPISCL